MVNKFYFGLLLSCIALPAAADPYADFKQRLGEAGLEYSLDISSMPQYSQSFAWQNMYNASATWKAAHNLAINFSYTGVKYFDKNAADVSNDMGVALPINDFPTNSHAFADLSLTYSFDALSMTLGQFPMYDFDGGRYNSDQQINFNNYALAQNATQMYPLAGLGGYISFSPNSTWSFSLGAQDATNLSGSKITTSGFDQKKITAFAFAAYKPKDGVYRLLVYRQPSVEGQLENSWGWSLNALHNFDKLGVFAAINGTTARLLNVHQSYSLGTVYNNPFDRNSQDQVGLAYSLNRLNTDITERKYESVIELYYDFGITNYFILSPDIQFYIQPGNDRSKTVAAAAALRFTALF